MWVYKSPMGILEIALKVELQFCLTECRDVRETGSYGMGVGESTDGSEALEVN